MIINIIIILIIIVRYLGVEALLQAAVRPLGLFDDYYSQFIYLIVLSVLFSFL